MGDELVKYGPEVRDVEELQMTYEMTLSSYRRCILEMRGVELQNQTRNIYVASVYFIDNVLAKLRKERQGK